MLRITQRYLNSFLTLERTLRFLEKKLKKRGSLRKYSLMICWEDSPKPKKAVPASSSACTSSPPSRSLTPFSVPVFPSTTFCVPYFSCNSFYCTPCNQCCYNCNARSCACYPGYFTLDTNCPLFQPFYSHCGCSCAHGSNIQFTPCIPFQFAPSLPFCTSPELMVAEKPSEVIFKNKGIVMHENFRYTPVGVDNSPYD